MTVKPETNFWKSLKKSLEGGEYIINAQTVDALGTPFLDELNSTQTSYH